MNGISDECTGGVGVEDVPLYVKATGFVGVYEDCKSTSY